MFESDSNNVSLFGTEQNDSVETPDGNPAPALQLEQAIRENMFHDSPESRANVYQEILFADLLLALSEPAVPATRAGGNMNINVIILANPQGLHFAAVFTSSEAARRWKAEGGHYVSLRGQDLFKLLENSPADTVVINPGSVPYIFLNKAEYEQLAMGLIPNTDFSPVQTAMSPDDPNSVPQGAMQISFPPNVFAIEQVERIQDVTYYDEHVEAAVIGAILPPQAPTDSGWLRTIFLRVKGLPMKQDDIQKFCIQVRDFICEGNTLFEGTPFEVGVMPDIKFWQAVHQNKFVLFDKNPPEIPPLPPENTGA